MTALHMAWTELRRITGTVLGKATLFALVLVPTVYAGLYLYANRDPYANLHQVPAALVMEDLGATDTKGRALEYGDDIAQELVDEGSFDFRESGRERALEGVDDGSYDFALVIPRNFSASLAGVAPDVESARIRMVTNDANSYLSTTIANQLIVDVREAIAEQVSLKAANTFLLGLSDVQETLIESADGVRRLDGGLTRAEQVSSDVSEDAAELAGDADALAELVGEVEVVQPGEPGLPPGVAPLQEAAQRLAGSSGRVAAQADDAAAAARTAAANHVAGRGELVRVMEERAVPDEDQAAILDVYDRAGRGLPRARSEVAQLRGQLGARAAEARQLAAAASRLAPGEVEAPQINDALDEVSDAAAELSGALEELSESSLGAGGQLERLTKDTSKLATTLADSAERIPTADEEGRAGIARTLGDPVEVQAASAGTETHGAGLAPLVLALAAWIGAVVLFWLVRPLSRRALAGNAPSWRTALGGWLAPAVVGVVQAALLMGATVAAIPVDDARLLPTFGFLVLVSVTFVAIAHALCAWLGVTGLFLALVLMFLQAITAGGAFPWETTPAVLHPMHYVLPMSYAVDGLRQLMFGGYSDQLVLNVGVLTAWLVGALLVAALVARRQRVWTPKKVAPDFVLR
jgi:putative membrane protein